MDKKDLTMTEQKSHDCSDALVVGYLLEHPDFFNRYPEVLIALEVGHGSDGTISLIEKQIAVLREKNNEIEGSRAELIETARANEYLSVCLHETALKLLRDMVGNCVSLSCADKASRVVHVCQTDLQKNIPQVRLFMHWFDDFFPNRGDVADMSILNQKNQRISSLVNSLFVTGNFHCGPFSEPERGVLFGQFASAMRSAVVAPLVAPVTKQRMGMLVLASDDTTRFAPGKGTVFLVQLIRLVESVFYPSDGARFQE